MAATRFICTEETKTPASVEQYLKELLKLERKTYLHVRVKDNKVRALEIGVELTKEQKDAILQKYPELSELA